MNESGIFEATQILVEILEDIGVSYFIGGSVASSVHGLPRSTLDVDLVADLSLDHIQPLVARSQDTFYIDDEMVEDAVKRQASFNVIHLETMTKLDVFVLKSTSYDRQAFERAHEQFLVERGTRTFKVATPEDIALHKLHWYRMGGEVSERQWNDVLGVLKVQAEILDMIYMRQWAKELQVDALLQRALAEAGLAGL